MSSDLDAVFAKAREFITPAIATKSADLDGKSAAQVLASIQAGYSAITRLDLKEVFSKASVLLRQLHDASQRSDSARAAAGLTLLNTSQISVLYPLLDLLLVEGIYPSLSSGVGFFAERQKRSLLCDRATTNLPNLDVLDVVLYDTLNPICFSRKPEAGTIGAQIHDRILIDLIAANADLANSPLRSKEARMAATSTFDQIIASVSSPILFPDLSALLKPSTPEWLRQRLSELLSLLPLRPRGVRHFIEFIARQYHEPLTSDSSQKSDQAQVTIGPEGIAQITKVLSSVPTTLDQESYFNRIAPQLTALLDGEDGPELSKVAAFVVTDGILSKRSIGSPGSIGWTLFVEPIYKTLKPAVVEDPVTEESLTIAQKRLWSLIRAHPSPSLTGRLARPLLPSLWGIATFKTPTTTPVSNIMAIEILQIFLHRCANLAILQWFQQNLNWTGSAEWKFAPSSHGGIEIRKTEAGDQEPEILSGLAQIEPRISTFMSLVSAAKLENSLMGDFFLQLTRESLAPPISSASLNANDESLSGFARTQILQSMLQQFGPNLIPNLDHTFELIEQVLAQVLKPEGSLSPLSKGNLTRGHLYQIVDTQPKLDGPDNKWTSKENTDDLIATITSLLTILIGSISYVSGQMHVSLSMIRQSLLKLSFQPPNHISSAILSAIASTVTLIDSKIAGHTAETASSRASKNSDLLLELTDDLSSPIQPIKTAALVRLKGMIKDITSKNKVDVPSLTLLLLNIIRTDSDSFVLQAAISTISSLASSRDSTGFVLRTCIDAFADRSQQNELDPRLRVGEALSMIVESLTSNSNLPISITQTISEAAASLLVIASRRGKRNKEARERDRAAKLASLKQRQAEAAWGGEIPNLDQLGKGESGGDNEFDEPAESEAFPVVQGWAQTALEEDVRIRTSAISILSIIIETAGPVTLTRTILDGVAEIACNILIREVDARKAILRRASCMIFMSELRAEHEAFEQSGIESQRLRWDGNTWLEVENILVRCAESDEDEVVKGHSRTVLESLEAFRMKRISVQSAAREGRFSLSGIGLSTLRGLNVSVPSSNLASKKIEEIE